MTHCPLCVIPAAGLGTRMGDLCKGVPKGLLEVNGKPIIRHVYDFWEPMVDQIVVVTGKDDLGFLKALPAHWGSDHLRFVVQSEPRGVPDAILCALAAVRCPRRFMVVLGDCLFRGTFDFDGAALGYWPMGMAVQQPTGNDWERSYSVVVEGQGAPDFESPFITSVSEKPGHGLGAYWMGWEALRYLEVYHDRSITEVYAWMLRDGFRVRPVPFSGEYLNVTYSEDLKRWKG